MLAQGRRTDLEGAVALVQGGAGVAAVAADMPVVYVKYHKGLQALRNTQFRDRSEKPAVTWLWGGTGVGKTRTATEGGSFYIKDATRWWDGYEQQETIVIDDFDGSWPFRDLLRLLDRYPYQGQTKGVYVKINSPKIFITCDRHPSEFWGGHEFEQLKRRLAVITSMGAELAGNTLPPLGQGGDRTGSVGRAGVPPSLPRRRDDGGSLSTLRAREPPRRIGTILREIR